MSDMCAHCGHSIAYHGRRGYGSCSFGRGGCLAAAFRAVRVRRLSGQQSQEFIRQAVSQQGCGCPVFVRGK